MKNYKNKEQDKKLEKIEGSLDTLNREYGVIKTDVSWLKWWMKVSVGAGITGVVIGLINLLGK